jgi:hypothetical protein
MLTADAAVSTMKASEKHVDTPHGSRLLKLRSDTVRQHTATHMQMWTKFASIYAQKLKIPATDNSDVLIAAAVYY